MSEAPSVARDVDAPSLLTRILGAVSVFVLGIAAGVLGTFAHQSSWSPAAGVEIPLGLLAAFAEVICLIAGIRLALESRTYAAIAALGTVASIALLALPGPSGSALLPANFAGYAWTLGPTLIAAIILAWPRTRRPR